jgi:N-acetylmuramoyl-L-alanine amidase
MKRGIFRLYQVKTIYPALAVLAGVLAAASVAQLAAQAPMPPQAPGPPASLPPAAPAIPSGQTTPGELTPKPAAPPAVLVILDPAHGGADSGAHANPEEEEAVEKDLVLAIALTMRREMERQGAHVLLTRQTDTAVSIDDRAALANGTALGFFVSLHVGSTGPPNTAVAYSFGAPPGGAPPVQPPRKIAAMAVRWDEAQNAYAVASRRFAELVQVELAQKLPGSPDVPEFAEVRQLRVVARPALAIELSSVGQEDAERLERTAVPLANALLRAIAAYRQSGGARP